MLVGIPLSSAVCCEAAEETPTFFDLMRILLNPHSLQVKAPLKSLPPKHGPASILACAYELSTLNGKRTENL